MTVPPEPKLDTDLYKGSSNTGYVVFLVDAENQSPKFVFGSDFQG